jgi:hypothetical protein
MTASAIALRTGASQAMPPDLSHLTPEKRAEYEAMHARMMSALAYERVTARGEQALTEWERLKSTGRDWPVVIGSDEDLERIAEQFSVGDASVFGTAIPWDRPRSPAEILAVAERTEFPDDLRKWPGASQPEDLSAPVGEWPSLPDVNIPGLTIATDIVKERFLEKVYILLLPAKHGWGVPAYLRWGNWNACPPPEYHCAALRKWHGRYGAELVGISGDTLNLRVTSRPGTREEAMALAREQYQYCPDIVDQGVGSISALAATRMATDWWYFWWD